MKRFINELQYNKSQIIEELELAKQLKNNLDFDEFGALVSTTTRIKIFRDIVNLFNYIRYNKYQEVIDLTPIVLKRIKLHIKQLEMLEQTNVLETEIYFKKIIEIIYMWITKNASSRMRK